MFCHDNVIEQLLFMFFRSNRKLQCSIITKMKIWICFCVCVLLWQLKYNHYLCVGWTPWLCGLRPRLCAPLSQCHHYREYQIITAARAGLAHFQSWQLTFAKISQCPEKNHNQRAAFRIYANQTIHIISYDIWGQQFQFNIYYRILYLDAGLA